MSRKKLPKNKTSTTTLTIICISHGGPSIVLVMLGARESLYIHKLCLAERRVCSSEIKATSVCHSVKILYGMRYLNKGLSDGFLGIGLCVLRGRTPFSGPVRSTSWNQHSLLLMFAVWDKPIRSPQHKGVVTLLSHYFLCLFVC